MDETKPYYGEPPEPFGPYYPSMGAAVAKFRHIPRGELTPKQARAYADAIENKIRALQRSALDRETPTIAPSCNSGTWHNNADGKVGAAVRAKQLAQLLAYPDKARAARTDEELLAAYREAMREKRNGSKKSKAS